MDSNNEVVFGSEDTVYSEFIAAHLEELKTKAAAAAGGPCPICESPLRLVDAIWLHCEQDHMIRCWTDEEVRIMQ